MASTVLGDQRVNPEEVLMQTPALVCGCVLRCLVEPLFQQVQGNTARGSLNIHHLSDLREGGVVSELCPPRALQLDTL